MNSAGEHGIERLNMLEWKLFGKKALLNIANKYATKISSTIT